MREEEILILNHYSKDDKKLLKQIIKEKYLKESYKGWYQTLTF